MELFDKKFVHFMWSDELKGKKVFFADSILILEKRVNDNDNLFCNFVKKNYDNEAHQPFASSVLDNSFTFAYYDPNYDCKRAFNEGKRIEYRKKDTGTDWIENPTPKWKSEYEYRIKPEETKEEPKNEACLTEWELAEWLAKGNGFICYSGDSVYTHYDTTESARTRTVEYTAIRVRRFGDEEWHKPTRAYCFGEYDK